MLPDRVSNPGPLTYESGVLPIALRGPATALVVLPYTMLHPRFQGHWSIGSGEDFFKVFTIYEHGGHVGHVTQTI